MKKRINISKKYIVGLKLIVALVISAISGIYYYFCLNSINIPMHSDDAGLSRVAWEYLQYSDKLSELSSIVDLLGVISSFFVGLSYYTSQIYFSLQFVIIIFLCILIFLLENKATWKIICFLWIVVMQSITNDVAGIRITKFHGTSVIISLSFLLLLIMYEKKILPKLIFTILSIIILIYGIMQIDITSFTFFVFPLAIVGFDKLCKYLDEKGKGYLGIYVGSFTIVFLCFLKMFGNWSYQGYGLRTIGRPWEIGHSIYVLIEGLLSAYNADLAKINPLSVSAILIGVKMLFVFGCVACWFKKLLKYKYLDTVDKYLVYTVFCSTIAYILEAPYEDILSVRYVGICVYVLPILFLRNIEEVEVIKKSLTIDKKRVSILLSTVCCALIVSSINNLNLGYPNNKLTKLEECLSENNFESGLASFWVANAVTAYSNGEINLQAVSYDIDNNKIFPIYEEYYMYKSKISDHNYIVYEKDSSSGLENYGQYYVEKPIDTIDVDNYVIQKYDYDVRYEPRKLMDGKVVLGPNDNLDLGIENVIYGKVRIAIKSSDWDNIQFSVYTNEKKQNIEYEIINKDVNIYYIEFDNKRNLNNVRFEIQNLGDGDMMFEDAELSYVSLASKIDIETQQNSKLLLGALESGTYQIEILGSDLKNGNYILLGKDNLEIDTKCNKRSNKSIVIEFSVKDSSKVFLEFGRNEDTIIDKCGYWKVD